MMKLTPFKCKDYVTYANIIIISPLCSDCMTFVFMDLIQSELDNVARMCLIRKSTAETVNGIPHELYYILEIRGG